MITTLHIKNIGIIDEINIDFFEGVNVLTGETGAGKTLIIESLGIICGGRFKKELIRSEKEYSLVEACFYLPDSKFAEEGNIIVSRQIFANGKNLCKVNGRMVTVLDLKSIMKNIVDIHAQNENQKIMEQSRHIEYLDLFIGKEIEKTREEFIELYEQRREIKKRLEENFGDEKQKQRTLDLLTYELNEINDAKLSEDEEEQLIQKQKKFQNSQKIVENLMKADDVISGKVLDELQIGIRYLSKISQYDEKYMQNYNILQEAYYNVQEVADNIGEIKYETEYDMNASDFVEKRLDIINNLKRKYGNNITEILNYRDNISAKISEIENEEKNNEILKLRLKDIEEKMYELSKSMNDIRMEYKAKLEKQINDNLKEMEMPNAKFLIDINFNNQNKFSKNGLSEVEFMISTNVGEDYKSLTKVASGGEISRIMLAIKSVLIKFDNIDVCVLDEIDTGISGKAAKAVSEKIKLMSKSSQIICVTHQAVVAACADHNYYISKSVRCGKTISNVKLLDDDEVINEIARISSGQITDISLKHAIELRRVTTLVS